jgi:hypothetical protein
LDNLTIYNALKDVPPEALRKIKAGRLKGKSDINPMWRIKSLTEQFGICGIGWKYEIVEKRLEQGANNVIAAFVDINLYIKVGSEWSAPIPGTGGSTFVAKETGGLYTNDECFKMALTDAISVSCKALGVGGSVYWEKDGTKYEPPAKPEFATASQLKQIKEAADNAGVDKTSLLKIAKDMFGVTDSKVLTGDQANQLKAKLKEMKDTV